MAMMGSQPEKFDALRRSIKEGDVLIPGDAGYEESLKRWSETCIKPAAVVVRPVSAEETSAAVKFAVANEVPLAVKGGGHSTSGKSASDGGMVIDLSRMRSVAVDVAAKTITFGGGCTWKDVDDAAWQHGFATVGGAVNDTGCGGLLLGGGYGFLASKHGLACDQLVSAQTVLADGTIVTSSATENADLFWALRGAGQSFGVTTSFTSRIHEQAKVWGGIIMLPWESMPVAVAMANNMHETQTPAGREVMHLVVGTCPPPDKQLVLTLAVFYDGTEAQGRERFAPVLACPGVVDHTSYKAYPDMNEPQAGQPPRRLIGGANFVMPLTPEYLQDLADDLVSFTRSKGIEEHSVVLLEIIPNRAILSVGSQDTAFSARNEMYQIATTFYWHDSSDDLDIRKFNRKLTTKLKEKGFRGAVRQYNNYEGGGDTIPLDDAYGQNAEKLRTIMSKYDPSEVFCKGSDSRTTRPMVL